MDKLIVNRKCCLILVCILILDVHPSASQYFPPQFQGQPQPFRSYQFVQPPLIPPPNQIFHPIIVEYGTIAPDNFPQKGILINGRFPGPPIRVKWYDILIIDVTNKLDHGITLHFHGIRNYGEPDAEGVADLSQELIPPGGSFRYIIKIGFQTGTFVYHLHTGLDSVWAFGPLIIEDGPELLAPFPEYYHHWDYVIILSQLWHTPISELQNSLEGEPSYKPLPKPQSILINGKSYGKWSKDKDKSNNNEQLIIPSDGYETILVKAKHTYRFRVIGFGADSMLTFRIKGHKLRIIEVDGIITHPVEVDRLEVNSGQRYSVLVTMDQEIGNYFIESEMIPGPGPSNGRAILQYEGADFPTKMKKKIFLGESQKVKLTRWETSKLYPNPTIRQPDIYLAPESVDKEIIMTSVAKNDTKKPNKVRYELNGKSYESPEVPWLFQVRQGVNITNEPKVFESLTNKSIQIVFQNVANDEGKCEQHAWHVHGHSFYVVGHGPEKYSTETDGVKINKNVQDGRHLVFRDVVTAYPEIDPSQIKPKEDPAKSVVTTDKPQIETTSEIPITSEPTPVTDKPETLKPPVTDKPEILKPPVTDKPEIPKTTVRHSTTTTATTTQKPTTTKPQTPKPTVEVTEKPSTEKPAVQNPPNNTISNDKANNNTKVEKPNTANGTTTEQNNKNSTVSTDKKDNKPDEGDPKIKNKRQTSKHKSLKPLKQDKEADEKRRKFANKHFNKTEDEDSSNVGKEFENLDPGTPCGWVAIRFVTDNPGVWLVHCHLTPHYILGEEFLIYAYQANNPKLLNG